MEGVRGRAEEGLWPGGEMLRLQTLGSWEVKIPLSSTVPVTLMMPAPVTTVTIPHRPAPPSLCLEHPSSTPPPQLFLFLQASGPSRKVSQRSLPGLGCLC